MKPLNIQFHSTVMTVLFQVGINLIPDGKCSNSKLEYACYAHEPLLDSVGFDIDLHVRHAGRMLESFGVWLSLDTTAFLANQSSQARDMALPSSTDRWINSHQSSATATPYHTQQLLQLKTLTIHYSFGLNHLQPTSLSSEHRVLKSLPRF